MHICACVWLCVSFLSPKRENNNNNKSTSLWVKQQDRARKSDKKQQSHLQTASTKMGREPYCFETVRGWVMAVGYGGLISIKDEADCTDCYLNEGEQTEAARGRNAVVINSRRVDRRQEHSNEPHIKFRGSKTFTFAPHSSVASLSVRTKTSVWHLSECSFRYFLPAELKDTPIMLPDSQTTVQSKVRLCWNMRKIKQSCHHEPLRTNSLNVKLEIKENAEQTEWKIQYTS